MKIILLSPAHPLRGGIAASSERLAQELQTEGHEVILYSFSLQYPAFLFPGKTQVTDDPPPPGLTIKTRLNSVNPINWLRVGRDIARERPDRIIVRFWLPFMGPALGTVLRVARFFARKKPHITALVDNIVPHEHRPGDRLFAGYFVGACDDFVVMSKSVGTEIQTFTSKKDVRFAPHPIYDNYGEPVEKSVARRELGLPEEVPLVLFFGFIREYKGLDLLLEALTPPLAPPLGGRGTALMPSLEISKAETAEIPLPPRGGARGGVELLLAGECYEDWAPYQRIIDQHGLGSRVHTHLDFIPSDKVRLYFSAADLVVQPYKSATQSGISQIAYHFEKPMVVTNVGGLPEIVTDKVSGYVVEPKAEAIAAAMQDFFAYNRAETMQAGVRAEKARFSWGNLVRALLA